MGAECVEVGRKIGAPRFGPWLGASQPEVEMEAFLASSHHAELLKYGIAYGALVAAAAEADTAAMRTHIETCRSGWPELAPLFEVHARRLEKLAGA